ncbi:hypothetical protein [Oryza sativa Japonica Group]|uniref:Uncharacterized protein n=1 Tax=Oryza sativa subsp. japonica TaxID=39947 RepID=Q8S172_ORYSJ|nr:hypothetical protein [Oryza sativa Japonica Group]
MADVAGRDRSGLGPGKRKERVRPESTSRVLARVGSSYTRDDERRRRTGQGAAMAMGENGEDWFGEGLGFIGRQCRREKTICVVRKVAEEKEGELQAADELEVVTTGPRLIMARIAREGGEGAQWRWPRRRLARSALTAAVPDRSTPPLGRCRCQRQLS